jgi:hypothetical protein
MAEKGEGHLQGKIEEENGTNEGKMAVPANPSFQWKCWHWQSFWALAFSHFGGKCQRRLLGLLKKIFEQIVLLNGKYK